ncbi:MAG: DUF1573 domain-containing protein [Candidatus Paraprevotella stercoravium]|uniref:DUF1573 domain-containing protein n=2 Tax=Bacteroidales TaxID=171549 RepID=A0ABT7U1X7_9BACE|nr:DUF1573 domain-containing protein [Candidatus Paraprevotella stercoravium]MDM8144525.1 DUF1573 domain-containing protein [Bacteroides eggerthii]
MKKVLAFTLLCFVMLTTAFAQNAAKQADIKFDKTSHNFGTFSEDDPVVTCVFKFTNTGTAPLIIHQAVPSCGCTVPTYTKEPIKPGESGKLEIRYNGAGKFPGHFKKSITVRTNGKTKMVRLYVEGTMEASKK